MDERINMEEEQLKYDPKKNDLNLIAIGHYKRQMLMLRTILNLKEEGYGIREVGMKVQVADSYIAMVFSRGEKQMIEYWKEVYEMGEEV